jgi:hypothetical protein
MTTEGKRRHVFISHHHRDDSELQKLTDLLNRNGYDLRNSSIRVKPENQRRLDQKKVNPETIRRLLRMKISWAGTVVVLIGKHTHSREWVNWEIDQAHRQGKRIVGVFTQDGTQNNIPPSFEKYGVALAAWNTNSIINAIDGTDNSFQNPDGTTRPVTNLHTVTTC